MGKNIKMTITQFNKYTDEEINTYTDTLGKILSMIENYEDYYYRITVFGKNTCSTRVKDTYFGVTVSSIGGLKFTEADYLNSYLNHVIAIYKKYPLLLDFGLVITRDIWYKEKMEKLSKNTEKDFQEEIRKFLDTHLRFKEITDLNVVKAVSGIYLLILDEYKACYIGQAKDMKKRIMRHWSRNDYFDGIGIDLFKAKDTTRIYVYSMSEQEYYEVDTWEYVYTNSIPKQYELNIMSGGKPDYLIENSLPLTLKSENEKCSNNIIDELQEYLIQMNEKVKQNMSRFII